MTAFLYIILGAVLCMLGGGALSLALTIGGVVLIVFGIIEIIKKNVWAGIGCIVAGILAIVGGTYFLPVTLVILGVLVAIKGLISLIGVLRRKKKSAVDILFAFLTIIAGIIICFGYGADLVIRIGGIVLAVNGIIALVGGLSKINLK